MLIKDKVQIGTCIMIMEEDKPLWEGVVLDIDTEYDAYNILWLWTGNATSSWVKESWESWDIIEDYDFAYEPRFCMLENSYEILQKHMTGYEYFYFCGIARGINSCIKETKTQYIYLKLCSGKFLELILCNRTGKDEPVNGRKPPVLYIKEAFDENGLLFPSNASKDAKYYISHYNKKGFFSDVSKDNYKVCGFTVEDYERGNSMFSICTSRDEEDIQYFVNGFSLKHVILETTTMYKLLEKLDNAGT